MWTTKGKAPQPVLRPALLPLLPCFGQAQLYISEQESPRDAVPRGQPPTTHSQAEKGGE